MSSQIFLSHSRHDEELLNAVADVFSKSGLKSYKAGFEQLGSPPSKTLKKEIENSVAMIVILGENADQRHYTKTWMAWEIGIATEVGIPIWVMEDVNRSVDMVVPYLTDYWLWDSNDEEQRRELRDVIDGKYRLSNRILESIGDALREQRNQNRRIAGLDPEEKEERGQKIKCPHERCGLKFRLRSMVPSTFDCPACRKEISLQ